MKKNKLVLWTTIPIPMYIVFFGYFFYQYNWGLRNMNRFTTTVFCVVCVAGMIFSWVARQFALSMSDAAPADTKQ
jgi:hypothetical protein